MSPRLTFLRVPPLTLLLLLLWGAPVIAQRGRDQAGTLPRAQQKDGEDTRAAFRAVVKEAGKSTVALLDDKGGQLALGTLVDPAGWVFTKASEVEKRQVLRCRLADGRTLEGKVAWVDASQDVALVKVEGKDLPSIAWGKAEGLERGAFVAAAGPGGEALAIGVISAAPRPLPRIPPIIGVNLGQDERGPRVIEVFPKTGAADAGVRREDVITHVAGAPVKDRQTLLDTLAEKAAGETIKLTLLRDRQTLEVEVRLMRRDGTGSNRQAIQNSLGSPLSSRRDGFSAVLQHDAVIAPNACGGPLVTLDGKAVGINIARGGRVETYALPADLVQQLATRMKALAEQKAKEAKEAKEPKK